MQLGMYRFSCAFQSPARLPVFKGSTLRGLFGHALKQVVCALRRQDCPGCLIKAQCLYPLVFETGLSLAAPAIPGVSEPPHPFVLEPPESQRTAYAPGDPFEFTLLLFGAVNRNLPYFVYTAETMGQKGIGALAEGARGRFSLARVDCGGQCIYTPGGGRLKDNPPIDDLVLEQPAQGPVHRLALRFHTPLRVKFERRFNDALPFHVIVRAMLRRTASLLACYDGGQPALDYGGLVARAGAVRTTASTLAWADRRRYSNRQETTMMMGGVTGSVTYEGDLTDFMPLIAFCSRVHIGKQTTFGLGRFTVEAAE